MAIYFFTEFNKFGPSPDRTYYEEVKALCEGKTSDYIEKVAYGMARDTVARAFPKFGPWNIVKRGQLPAIGDELSFHGSGRGAQLGQLLGAGDAGDRPSLYVYRDWPDAQTFGEWAVPTEREVNDTNRSGWDGDVGPAQAGIGMGIVKYKQTFLGVRENPQSTIHNPQSGSVSGQAAGGEQGTGDGGGDCGALHRPARRRQRAYGRGGRDVHH